MICNVSVAMATFNGEKYIKNQIFSILNQSHKVDEIIIVDDSSTDNTIKIIKSIQCHFSNITLIENKLNIGPILSFKLAISNCKNDYVLLSDQDDIWYGEKVKINLAYISKIKNTNKPLIVFSDLCLIDDYDTIINKSFWNYHNFGARNLTFKNLLHYNCVTGCTIMMNKLMKEEILCMPENIMMHDHWIALIAFGFGDFMFIDTPLVKYRTHSNTVTNKFKTTFFKKILNILYKVERSQYLNKNIDQAKLFYNIYKDKLSKENNDIILRFLKNKTKTFVAKKFFIYFNKYR